MHTRRKITAIIEYTMLKENFARLHVSKELMNFPICNKFVEISLNQSLCVVCSHKLQ